MKVKLILFFISLSIALSFSLKLPAKQPEKKLYTDDSSTNLSLIENRTFDLINSHRKAMNLPMLIRNDAIVIQARQHSADMASGKISFGHDGASKRLKTIRKTLIFMNGGGENVFECSSDYDDLAAEAVKGWLESEGHRENIEGEYNLSGIGVARAENGDYYFTQIFVKGH